MAPVLRRGCIVCTRRTPALASAPAPPAAASAALGSSPRWACVVRNTPVVPTLCHARSSPPPPRCGPRVCPRLVWNVSWIFPAGLQKPREEVARNFDGLRRIEVRSSCGATSTPCRCRLLGAIQRRSDARRDTVADIFAQDHPLACGDVSDCAHTAVLPVAVDLGEPARPAAAAPGGHSGPDARGPFMPPVWWFARSVSPVPLCSRGFGRIVLNFRRELLPSDQCGALEARRDDGDAPHGDGGDLLARKRRPPQNRYAPRRRSQRRKPGGQLDGSIAHEAAGSAPVPPPAARRPKNRRLDAPECAPHRRSASERASRQPVGDDDSPQTASSRPEPPKRLASRFAAHASSSSVEYTPSLPRGASVRRVVRGGGGRRRSRRRRGERARRRRRSRRRRSRRRRRSAARV